ncbi:STS14 protein-like [Lotus japonicus]|uniref:STS14 protein-like n=1 Tax=Lotus japonicus TaxID=34305 RepID=UPI002582AFB3|nr:STS14 protein-like [Lotus japonicus]
MSIFMQPFFSLALALFLLSAEAATVLDSVVPQLSAEAKEFLDAHNWARAEVGVEPLEWSEALAKDAGLFARYQRDRLGCKLANFSHNKYGSNQDLGGMGWTPSVAVQDWVNEKEFYSYRTNSCVAPSFPCWHYTQVVWRKSKQVGCAQLTCVVDKLILTICFYDPPGNINGESPY